MMKNECGLTNEEERLQGRGWRLKGENRNGVKAFGSKLPPTGCGLLSFVWCCL